MAVVVVELDMDTSILDQDMRERSDHASDFTSPIVHDGIKTTKNASDKEVVKHQTVHQEGKETEPTRWSSRRMNAPDWYT